MASRASATARPTCTRRCASRPSSGAWAHEGGGAFHSNSGVFKLDKTLIEGLDARDQAVRSLDQSRIGAVLTGEREALEGGGPVKAMLIQNTNPLVVAPDQEKVRRGFAREDLFVCVHEQFLTDTARAADIVLPATMFLEHDDLYTGGGHQYLQFGPKTIEPPEGCRSNHEVIAALAERVGAEPSRLCDEPARDHRLDACAPPAAVRWPSSRQAQWLDCQPPFEEAHFLNGFAYPDGKFRFRADWATTPYRQRRPEGRLARDADPARPLGGQRSGGRRAPVQARDLARAQLPQFELHRDADLARARAAPDGADATRATRRGSA